MDFFFKSILCTNKLGQADISDAQAPNRGPESKIVADAYNEDKKTKDVDLVVEKKDHLIFNDKHHKMSQKEYLKYIENLPENKRNDLLLVKQKQQQLIRQKYAAKALEGLEKSNNVHPKINNNDKKSVEKNIKLPISNKKSEHTTKEKPKKDQTSLKKKASKQLEIKVERKIEEKDPISGMSAEKKVSHKYDTDDRNIQDEKIHHAKDKDLQGESPSPNDIITALLKEANDLESDLKISSSSMTVDDVNNIKQQEQHQNKKKLVQNNTAKSKIINKYSTVEKKQNRHLAHSLSDDKVLSQMTPQNQDNDEMIQRSQKRDYNDEDIPSKSNSLDDLVNQIKINNNNNSSSRSEMKIDKSSTGSQEKEIKKDEIYEIDIQLLEIINNHYNELKNNLYFGIKHADMRSKQIYVDVNEKEIKVRRNETTEEGSNCIRPNKMLFENPFLKSTKRFSSPSNLQLHSPDTFFKLYCIRCGNAQ